LNNLREIYRRRFGDDIEFRAKLWAVLCNNFFQKYVPENSIVLDIGAGYCEFINNIKASKRFALDLNPDIKEFASKDVDIVLSKSTDMEQIKDRSIDVVFTSNFFEHLSKEDIVKTIKEIYRVLKNGGSFLILQPNIRYCYKDYWMFFDHITPLDDRSLSEILEINGFKVLDCKPRFLPYTTKSRLPKSVFLLKLYLKIPQVQWLLGKQAFVFAKKRDG
jgi:ubiquinone/menaquinone biosynthesis C-methylase UbiE